MELQKFYNDNFKIEGIKIVVDIDIYLKIGINTLLKNENEIEGSMISILIPIKDTIFACSTLLIVKNKGIGNGRKLIVESLNQFKEQFNGVNAYFINSIPRGEYSIPFNFYSYVSNIKYAQYRNHKNMYNISTNCKIEKITNEKYYYEKYIQMVENKKFVFYPTFDYWCKWLNYFPIYCVLLNSEIIGFFSFNNFKIDSYKNGNLMFCFGEQPETLKCACLLSKTLFDFLYIYEVGDLSSSLILSLHCRKEGRQYINFIKKNTVTSKEFYAPII